MCLVCCVVVVGSLLVTVLRFCGWLCGDICSKVDKFIYLEEIALLHKKLEVLTASRDELVAQNALGVESESQVKTQLEIVEEINRDLQKQLQSARESQQVTSVVADSDQVKNQLELLVIENRTLQKQIEESRKVAPAVTDAKAQLEKLEAENRILQQQLEQSRKVASGSMEADQVKTQLKLIMVENRNLQKQVEVEKEFRRTNQVCELRFIHP